METLIWSAHVLTAIIVIVLVLLQHGKGADMGAAFGSGSSGSLFGASGSATFLSRATAVIAAIFFATSLGLTYLSSNRVEDKGVMSSVMDEINESNNSSVAIDAESIQENKEISETTGLNDSSRAGQIPE
ncbi:protein translocase subunit secG [Nitrosomonas cryotolerans]|uniref:Protein-export membrane protein SecG n=1 Tax=Nitrosomonas cryotolerans ATCC 49181 TaxID=1131553 RepID=A0A1N6GG59_9PROT|nr:preprotein translocase subunit SecG [Nitrosomonas cryotolerans]SFP57343.1 protein translocase subunit secG [Nitrosomonas cryotolerans]SIO06538.1 protein translocase subunit secG [Nitrosomonas cryotolerans ATCC 49181]